MKRLSISSLLLACAALPLAASPAMADAKVYSASTCVNVRGNIVSFVDTSDRMINSSVTIAARVICPLIRDDAGVKPTSIQVAVVDNSSALTSTDFFCKVHHGNATGSSGVVGTTVKTSGTNSAGVVLNLPIPTTHFINGTYAVDCTIPRRGAFDDNSWIGSIRMVEPNGNN